MMLDLNSILVFSENPEILSSFYEKVLQKKPDWTEGGYFGFMAGSTFLTIGPHDKVHGKNTQPERIMINFETPDVKGEFERIKELDVKVIKEPYSMMPDDKNDMLIATFEDPDGNFFQLMSPFKV